MRRKTSNRRQGATGVRKSRWLLAGVFIAFAVAVAIFVVEGRRFSQEAQAPGAGDRVIMPPRYDPSPYAAPPAQEKLVRCATHPTEMRPMSSMVPVEHKGATYYMCCQDCVRLFKQNPEKYLRELKRAEAASGP